MSPWWPDPNPLLTRAELVAQLQAKGVAITPRTLAFWESEGVIPRAVRRFHNGQTQATYPAWMLGIVATVREMQDAGYSLDAIRNAIQLGLDATVWVLPPGTTLPQIQERWRNYQDLADELAPLIAELGRRWERATGRNLNEMTLLLRDETGREAPHEFGDPWSWLDPDLDGSLPNWSETVDRLKSLLIDGQKHDSVDQDRE